MCCARYGGVYRHGTCSSATLKTTVCHLHLLKYLAPSTPPGPQVIASMEAPLDRPMEVDLEGLLAQVGNKKRAKCIVQTTYRQWSC